MNLPLRSPQRLLQLLLADGSKWGNGARTIARRPDYKLYEYVCENNREYADPETGEARLRLFGE